ncbi:MAG: type II secretion system minor pseudopilin GspI [bacterium]
MTRQPTHGFTLIEALIALAILAITAVSFLRATEANVARVTALETRAAASWAAQNRLAELTLGTPVPSEPVELLGRSYKVDVATTPTADPQLNRIDISATLTDQTASTQLTGFVWNRAGGS